MTITTDLRAVEQLATAMQNDCRSFLKRRGKNRQSVIEIMQALATMVGLYMSAEPELKTYFDKALAETIREFRKDEVRNH